MRLTHPLPCSDCPWRRDSLRGFLGGTELIAWSLAWHVKGPFPCHNTTPVEPNGDVDTAKLDEASYCAGHLIARANVISREPALARWWTREYPLAEVDHERVFDGIEEFEEHHGAGS